MDRCCSFSDYGIPISDEDECEGSESETINEAGKYEDLENRPEKKVVIHGSVPDYNSDSDSDSYEDNHERLHRVMDAQSFMKGYKFTHGGKYCIYPDGVPIFTLSDKCYEPTWVGVYGMQSICMVTCRYMDMTSLHPFYHKDKLKHHNMRLFAKSAICELECLPHKDIDYCDNTFRQLCTGTVEKPFAVVSLGPGTLVESGCEDLEVINYLESVVSSELLHTHYGIIQVAIKAYQLICHKELRAKDIWVSIMNLYGGWIDHLPTDVIGEQLALVNGFSSEKDPQKPLFVFRNLRE